jgi:hypothetical protein
MTHRFKYLGTQEDHQGHRDFGVLQYIAATGEIRAVPFYRSTGKNSGSPGQWFPFHGVNNSHEPMEVHVDGSGKPILSRPHKGWFIKPQAGMADRYNHDHGPRYGHGKLANLAEWMDENIADYQFNRSESVDNPNAINGALHDANAWGMHPNANAGPPPPPPPPDTVQTGEPMDLAWQLLKRQTELGEFHPDLPSSMGPVVAFHGKNLTPERKKEIQVTGIKPYDTREAQIGSGRYQQYENLYDDKGEIIGEGEHLDQWNKDIPANVSVTSNVGRAEDYAYKNRRHAGDSEPVVFGVRAGALENQLPLDDPRRRYGPRGGFTDDPALYTDPNAYRYIAHGIDPKALVAMTTGEAKRLSQGNIDRVGREKQTEFESSGPLAAYDKAWLDHDKKSGTMPHDQFMEEGFTAAFGAQEGFTDNTFQEWQAQQAAQAAAQAELQRRKEAEAAMKQPDWTNQTTLSNGAPQQEIQPPAVQPPPVQPDTHPIQTKLDVV